MSSPFALRRWNQVELDLLAVEIDALCDLKHSPETRSINRTETSTPQTKTLKSVASVPRNYQHPIKREGETTTPGSTQRFG